MAASNNLHANSVVNRTKVPEDGNQTMSPVKCSNTGDGLASDPTTVRTNHFVYKQKFKVTTSAWGSESDSDDATFSDDDFSEITKKKGATGSGLREVDASTKINKKVDEVSQCKHLCNGNKGKSLLDAAKEGHDGCVVSLLEGGADVNTVNTYGDTALKCAAFHGCHKCLEILLQAGANVNVKNYEGHTALIAAATNGHLSCVQSLIQAGSKVNSTDGEMNTALISAAKCGQRHCIEYLLKAGADVNGINRFGYTALLYSAEDGDLECVKLLVKAGPDVNRSRKHGNTPLISAVEGNYFQLCTTFSEGRS